MVTFFVSQNYYQCIIMHVPKVRTMLGLDIHAELALSRRNLKEKRRKTYTRQFIRQLRKLYIVHMGHRPNPHMLLW